MKTFHFIEPLLKGTLCIWASSKNLSWCWWSWDSIFLTLTWPIFLIVSISVVTRVVSTWLIIMDVHLSPFISWPTRSALHKTMPQCFINSFVYKTTVIIDCFEYLLIDQPISWQEHRLSSIISKFLTENRGFFRSLLPGDLVLADRDFTIHDEVMLYHANLNISAFTKGESQLDPVQIVKNKESC